MQGRRVLSPSVSGMTLPFLFPPLSGRYLAGILVLPLQTGSPEPPALALLGAAPAPTAGGECVPSPSLAVPGLASHLFGETAGG